ncbi:uncharacterized protein F5891DRAFT_1192689 [Suillus fuscotomentosus]|uniref:DUF6532 domain-containing protein n=1 Tax=Suillus fuscotomentosus TaxID=1912939 RepID=A0AAD4E1Y2_9AGAM|nr:uncharacterized protein F5891DRAFT_1192689 [Suillus fuscotomentosus]KAG1896793.1 hypothetical protein F5891DRAFT_1192689 [Suillus fuscotomentosus]
MPSQPADTTVTRRTRPSNAIAHPEVAAARAEKAEQAAARAAAVEAGAKRIAGIELEMEAKQTSMLARKAKGVRPRPIPAKGKKVAVKDGLSQADVTAAYGEGDEMGLKDDSKKKITKVSMKDAVNQAREQIKQTTSADGGDKDARVHKKGDSMDVTVNKPEYTFSSKVKSWVSDVDIPIKNQNAPLSHVTHTSPPPSTVFSRLTGSSKTTHSEILTGILNSPQCSGVDEDIPGGFADDEDEDEIDKLERLAAHGITTKEGRSAAATVLTLTIDDSDDELEIPAEFRALFTQPSPVGLPKASFAVGNLKRKASEGSEIEDLDFLSVDAFDNTMEIDLPDKSDLTYEVKPGKPPHITSSTSVVTTDTKPALTKKAKVESLKVSTSLHATPAKPKEHQESLWSIPDETLLTHIQIAFQAVYPELNLVIVQNGAVFSLTVQRLSEWRSNFSSTAIAIIFDFLTSNNDCDPEVLAGLLLKNFAFIFKDMDKCEPDGAFHSAFMLQLLGKAHLSTINGHATIPALKTKDLATKGMAGVIAFCATALERAITLISDGDIKVEDILASTSAHSKLNIKLPKVLNKVTRKVTSAPYLFSRDLWG